MMKLAEGAALLPGFASAQAAGLVSALESIVTAAPFRHMITRGGFRMSVAMTNCGRAGWVTDASGYRYDPLDPETGRHWPPMPAVFLDLAIEAASQVGFPNYEPDVCLISRYEKGARLSLHQDKDEQDFVSPIVSVSLGPPAVFLFGGHKRSERPRRIPVKNGDVVVWGGPSRLAFHGVAPLAEGEHPATGSTRINLSFRKALSA
jgi:alkylated DNA repair protein (DNA oxidative demethylase)